MTSTEVEIAVLKNQMQNIEKKVDDGFSEIKAIIKEHNEFIDKQLDQKAGKWVEKPLIAVGATIGIAVLGSILSLIIIKS